MPRHKGSPVKIDAKKPGVKKGARLTKEPIYFTQEEEQTIKEEVVRLFENAEVSNLTEAAELLQINPIHLYKWREHDTVWKTTVDEFQKAANEVTADRLEQELTEHTNFIPKIFILKGLRPKFRENYHDKPTSPQVVELLVRLREAAQPEQLQPSVKIELLPEGENIREEVRNVSL